MVHQGPALPYRPARVTTKLQNYSTTKLQTYRTTKLHNYKTALYYYSTTKLHNYTGAPVVRQEEWVGVRAVGEDDSTTHGAEFVEEVTYVALVGANDANGLFSAFVDALLTSF